MVKINCGASFEVWWWLSIEFYLLLQVQPGLKCSRFTLLGNGKLCKSNLSFLQHNYEAKEEENEASVCLCKSQIYHGRYLNLIGKGSFEKFQSL
ncbi:hypothetical protein ACET3Z_000517 [Daucus carota]